MNRLFALLSLCTACLFLTMCGGAGGPTNTGDTNPADYFTLSITPSNLNVNIGGGGRGGNQDVTIKMIPVDGFTNGVTLMTPTGLPTGVTAEYVVGTSGMCQLTASSPCTVKFSADPTATVGQTSTITIPADAYRLASTKVTANITVMSSLGATITQLQSSSGAVNTPVTVIGTGFGATQGSSTLSFTLQHPMTTNILSWSDTTITALVPTAAITGNVSVTVNGVGSNLVMFTVVPAAANYTNGTWTTLSTQMPSVITTTSQWGTINGGLNPIHMALLHTNQILIVGGSGNCPTNVTGCPQQNSYQYGAGIFDLDTKQITTIAMDWDAFCNGMSIQPDGTVLIAGGTLDYGQLAPVGQGAGTLPFLGLSNAAVYTPVAGQMGSLTNIANMAHGRWYPTVTELGNGSMFVSSGLLDTYGTASNNYDNNNNSSEIWNGSAWSAPISDINNMTTLPYPTYQLYLYPRLHLLPTGHLFYSAPDSATSDFDPSTNTWTFLTWTAYPCSGPDQNCTPGAVGDRTYGTSVLLPMTPANGYDPTVMILGGDNPATYTTELIDFNPNGNFYNNPPLGTAAPCAYSPFCFVEGPPMIQPRVDMEGTILPNGQVLVDSGSAHDEVASSASLDAQLYTPANPKGIGSFTPVAPNTIARLYHNTQLLLPDGTVLLAGSNPGQGTFEPRMEVFTPPYLFNSDGTAATRPTISAAPTSITYGTPFMIGTPNTNIATVVLMKAGSVTHSFDMDQRHVGLSFTTENGGLNVSTSAINSNIAPPGYYMLYVVNAAGVPSLSTWIQVGGATAQIQAVKYHPELVPTPAWRIRLNKQVTENPLRSHAHDHMMQKEAVQH